MSIVKSASPTGLGNNLALRSFAQLRLPRYINTGIERELSMYTQAGLEPGSTRLSLLALETWRIRLLGHHGRLNFYLNETIHF